MKMFNHISVVSGLIFGTIINLLRGWDIMLKCLLIAVILDYITGLIKAIYNKTLSSEIGYKGILKKVVVFIVVALSVLVDRVLTEYLLNSVGIDFDTPFRTIVCVFFLCNEGISILENASLMGIRIPKKLKQALLQLRDKEGGEDNE